MDTRPTNTREAQLAAKHAATDWHALDQAGRIRHLELEGYVVIPELLTAAQLDVIRAELALLPTRHVDYSVHQRAFYNLLEAECPASLAVVALPAMTAFLDALLADRLICTSIGYTCAEPGHPGIAVHTDSQPYGSQIFGVQASSPCLVRCLYYLDDLTTMRSPFKVIPRSHLSLHRDANPYHRYLAHPDEELITCTAGSAVIINQKVFHGNYPNYSTSDRRMLAIAYRPAWAGPIAEVPERDPAAVARLPPGIRKFFGSMNTRDIAFDLPNRPDNLATDAPGISPRRWGEAE